MGNYCYNNFFSKSTIIGIYVNTNYNYQPFLVEIPYVADTLKLLSNNQFESNFWGKGNYILLYKASGTEIELFYKYEFGKAAYQTSISRINWGNPKIILNKDKGHYYEKIE